MYDSPCMTWTVYWTLNLRRLPTLIISALFTGYPECLPPAPIISLNSDSDSALPTLCLKLVFEFCLSDLHFVLLKPHMDPHASDSALQKTSPEIDPAVFFHFTTEVSAQATILVTHQQQLTRLTLLTEEMITAVRELRQQTPVAQTPAANIASPDPISSTAITSPRLAFPDKFDGSPSKCKGFLLQCSMFVSQQPRLYSTEESPLGSGRVQFITEEMQLRVGALHTETISLFVFQSPQTPIILGLPWLEKHNPSISWSERQITQWSESCKQNCLPSNSRKSRKSTCMPESQLPAEYSDLAEAFSKTKATQLPPHRTGDCVIDLQPGSQPPKGRIFPLSQPESESMKSYIEEELAKGFLRPSTSPASAGFFFVKKKDGGLHPCIDYRGLNDITIVVAISF